MSFHPLNPSSLLPLHFPHINPLVATLGPGLSFVVVGGVKFIENLVNIEGDRLPVEIFNPDSNSWRLWAGDVVTKERPGQRVATRGLMRGKWRGGREEGLRGWKGMKKEKMGVVMENRTGEEGEDGGGDGE